MTIRVLYKKLDNLLQLINISDISPFLNSIHELS